MSETVDAAHRAKLQARLDRAEEAYDELMVGGGVREIKDQNGESVVYSPASSSRLAQYIQSLKIELGLLKAPGPARPFW